MKLPPICAEFPLSRKDERTKSTPPNAAEIIESVPRVAKIRTFLDWRSENESARTTIERASKISPSAAW